MTDGVAAHKATVVVVGSCIWDVSMRVPRLPVVDETVIGDGVVESLGGKGANQAVALARLGCSVSILTCLGNDIRGSLFLELFAEEGIDSSFVKVGQTPTGLGVPLVLGGGRNAIVVAPSAAMALRAADVERVRPRIREADALLLQLETPLEVAEAAIAAARAWGRVVFLNPAPVTQSGPALVPLADVLVPNSVEASRLSGVSIGGCGDALRAADALRALGPRVVVVTMGESGAAVSCNEFRGIVPGYMIDSVDTTGAGDAFCAGLVYSHCRGVDWRSAVGFANACGAAACRRRGAIPAMPTREVVESIIASAGSRSD